MEMLCSPLFWFLYVMFVLVAASGLVVTAQVAPIASDSSSRLPVNFSVHHRRVIDRLVVDNILNGLARPFFGWVSDHIGRENTMAIVFTLGAVAYWALGTIGTTPWMFIVTAGLVFFTWGEIYSLFPATCTDIRSEIRHHQRRAALHGQGHGVVLVPAASWLQSQTGAGMPSSSSRRREPRRRAAALFWSNRCGAGP